MKDKDPGSDTGMRKNRKKLIALSAIVGTIIAVGVTAAAGGGLFYVFQSQTDPFSTSAALEIRNLNALRDGDELTVTATIKNTGQTSLTQLYIDSISVSAIDIAQNNDGVVIVDNGDEDQGYCSQVVTSTLCAVGLDDGTERRGFSISTNGAGLVEESVLEGGRTQAFKLVIEATDPTPTDTTNEVDISEDVNISDQLTMTLRFNSGDDTLVSDAYSTRVRSG